MKEIVWVAGVSASGKATFIEKILSHSLPQIEERLGWQGKNIAVCQESLDMVKESSYAGRDAILERVPELLDENDIVLIKWQFVDSSDNRPIHLKQKLPEAKHRVIVLEAAKETLLKRLPNKDWWYDHGRESEYYDTQELAPFKKVLGDLAKDFVITTINSTNEAYEINQQTPAPSHESKCPFSYHHFTSPLTQVCSGKPPQNCTHRG